VLLIIEKRSCSSLALTLVSVKSFFPSKMRSCRLKHCKCGPQSWTRAMALPKAPCCPPPRWELPRPVAVNLRGSQIWKIASAIFSASFSWLSPIPRRN